MAATRSKRIACAFRAPALHFAVIGAALFAVNAYTTPADDGVRATREPLVIDARRLDELRRDYSMSMGETPDAAAESRLVESEINDELLYREAVRLGLDRADRTVYWRLVEKMKFLGEARAQEHDDELFRRALDMGLQDKDPVIRRVMIRKVGMLIRFAGDEAPPSEAELRDYYDRHPALYGRPRRATLVHVFFSNDARGERARADAERALEELRKNDNAVTADADDGAVGLGDPFLGGHVFNTQARGSLAKLFGEEFADAALAAPRDSWQGPVRSAFGFHLVAVREREDAGRMPLAAVRTQVAAGVEEERHDARLTAKLAELRTRYDVRVETGTSMEASASVDDGDA